MARKLLRKDTSPQRTPNQFFLKPAHVFLILLAILVLFVVYSLGKKSTTNIPRIYSPIPTTYLQNIVMPEQSTARTSPSQIKSMPLVSTVGWKTVNYQGISFMIPPEAIFENGYYKANSSLQHVLPIRVEQYNGGSRRDQFLGSSSYNDCRWIFEDAYFGNVQALQIAADGGWCQGSAGGIVTVIGNKLVSFGELYYDPATRVIPNDPAWNTVISTVRLTQ